MSYLPGFITKPIEETQFPRALDKDLFMQVRMIEEMWARKFPTIEYHPMRKAQAPAPQPRHCYPSSDRSLDADVAGTVSPTTSFNFNVIDIFSELASNISIEKPITQFDALWGESVDERMQLPTEGWQQPHTTDMEAEIENVEKHDGPFYLHAQVRREVKQRELKKYGFDEIRDLLVNIPLSLLDRHGISVSAGDWFVWDDAEYTVLQKNRVGYWMNTNIRLYMALDCEHRRRGS